MQIKIITDLTTEPVTLAEAKSQIVMDQTIDDVLITSKIKVARQWLEQYTGLAFGEKTIKVYYDSFDTDYSLPIGPVIGELTTVTRLANGSTGQPTSTVLTTSDYWVSGLDYPTLEFTKVWTSCGLSKVAYTVEYQAGYDDENPLPEPIKEAILKLTAELYRDRENTVSGTINTMLPYHVRSLVSPYRRNVLL
jgi:uncharacterized phiE125 gp8 family phage protein